MDLKNGNRKVWMFFVAAGLLTAAFSAALMAKAPAGGALETFAMCLSGLLTVAVGGNAAEHYAKRGAADAPPAPGAAP